MIGQLRGSIVERQPTYLLVDVQGVGYEVTIPVSTYQQLPTDGDEVRLLTYLHVREDAMQLFGFATAAEKNLFLKLIQVSGVGPRVAIGMLSGCSVEELQRSIREGDVARLKSLPGIGKKTAERLILELREKVGAGAAEGMAPTAAPADSRGEEAMLALSSLGFSRAQAQRVVQKLLGAHPDAPVEELVRLALKEL